MSQTPQIPPKSFYKVNEVCQYTDTQPYVLRFWESEFPQLAPQKNKTGQRVYSRKDLDLILKIKKLLHEEEYTIAGARQKLADDREGRQTPVAFLPDDTDEDAKTPVAIAPEVAVAAVPEASTPGLFDASPAPAGVEIETIPAPKPRHPQAEEIESLHEEIVALKHELVEAQEVTRQAKQECQALRASWDAARDEAASAQASLLHERNALSETRTALAALEKEEKARKQKIDKIASRIEKVIKKLQPKRA